VTLLIIARLDLGFGLPAFADERLAIASVQISLEPVLIGVTDGRVSPRGVLIRRGSGALLFRRGKLPFARGRVRFHFENAGFESGVMPMRTRRVGFAPGRVRRANEAVRVGNGSTAFGDRGRPPKKGPLPYRIRRLAFANVLPHQVKGHVRQQVANAGPEHASAKSCPVLLPYASTLVASPNGHAALPNGNVGTTIGKVD